MNENYYKYYEIIYSLRKEYLENEKLLAILKSHIQIDCDEPYSFSFNLLLHKDNIEPLQLMLRIVRQQSKFKNMMDRLYAKVGGYNVQGATRNISIMKTSEGNNRLSLVDDKFDAIFHKTFRPKVEIIDLASFKEIYDELMHSKFAMLPKLYRRINEFQSLYIDGNLLGLWNQFEHRSDFYSIDYIPEEDIISLDLGNQSSSYFAEKLLNTKIPKYEFPDEYRQIIESNLDIDRFYFDDILKKSKNELEIIDSSKKLVLRRRQLINK